VEASRVTHQQMVHFTHSQTDTHSNTGKDGLWLVAVLQWQKCNKLVLQSTALCVRHRVCNFVLGDTFSIEQHHHLLWRDTLAGKVFVCKCSTFLTCSQSLMLISQSLQLESAQIFAKESPNCKHAIMEHAFESQQSNVGKM